MPPMHFTDSAALRRYMADRDHSVALLSFSGGKDSLGVWLALREHFERIIPVYLYLVPGLQFIEDGIRYFEDTFQTHIYRLPHPSLYRQLRNNVFQAPEHLRTLDEMSAAGRLEQFDYQDIFDVVRAHLNLPTVSCALGVRAVDSPARWVAIKHYGPVNEARNTWYPIFDWRKDQLVDTIRASGIKLPHEYRYFGRSFDGVDYRFLHPIRAHYPVDYARILQWFPLAELEIKRIEYREAFYGKNPPL
jgi:hypothetical protein